MPELPEVQTVLDGFTEAIKDKYILDLECYYPGTVIHDPEQQDEPFPAKMISTRRRGKYMIVELDNGSSFIIHLRMTGKLVFSTLATEPLPHERARFILEGDELVHFIDIRTFGKIIHCTSTNVSSYLPNLGLEPLEQEFSYATLAAKLKSKKAPIKTVLLDQSIIAGLGNIYVCEILYRTGILPTTPAESLNPKSIKNIVKECVTVLNQAIQMGGTSISDFRRIDDKTGEFQRFLQVYQKAECPLGHKTKRIVQGGRSSFYCPICQK